MEKDFKVAVFPRRGKKTFKFTAYTRDVNTAWDGCNMVNVSAKNGTEAKQKAIWEIKKILKCGSEKEILNVKICRE